MLESTIESNFRTLVVHRRLADTYVYIAVPAWLGWGMAGLQYVSSYQTINKYGTLLFKVS